jgi:hypothetical protein
VHGGGGGCFCNFSYIFQYCTNKILMLQKYQFDVHCNIFYVFSRIRRRVAYHCIKKIKKFITIARDPLGARQIHLLDITRKKDLGWTIDAN